MKMKLVDSLTVLFGHNRWANLCLLDCCAKLTPEQLNARIPGSFGTIYETLEHFVTSERSYFTRITTGQRYLRPERSEPLTIAELMEISQSTGAGLIEWAAKVQPEDTVVVDWEGTPRDVPKTILLLQVINHATEHREQIKAILTGIGIEPPDLQGWEYFDQVDR